MKRETSWGLRGASPQAAGRAGLCRVWCGDRGREPSQKGPEVPRAAVRHHPSAGLLPISLLLSFGSRSPAEFPSSSLYVCSGPPAPAPHRCGCHPTESPLGFSPDPLSASPSPPFYFLLPNSRSATRDLFWPLPGPPPRPHVPLDGQTPPLVCSAVRKGHVPFSQPSSDLASGPCSTMKNYWRLERAFVYVVVSIDIYHIRN